MKFLSPHNNLADIPILFLLGHRLSDLDGTFSTAQAQESYLATLRRSPQSYLMPFHEFRKVGDFPPTSDQIFSNNPLAFWYAQTDLSPLGLGAPYNPDVSRLLQIYAIRPEVFEDLFDAKRVATLLNLPDIDEHRFIRDHPVFALENALGQSLSAIDLAMAKRVTCGYWEIIKAADAAHLPITKGGRFCRANGDTWPEAFFPMPYGPIMVEDRPGGGAYSPLFNQAQSPLVGQDSVQTKMLLERASEAESLVPEIRQAYARERGYHRPYVWAYRQPTATKKIIAALQKAGDFPPASPAKSLVFFLEHGGAVTKHPRLAALLATERSAALYWLRTNSYDPACDNALSCRLDSRMFPFGTEYPDPTSTFLTPEVLGTLYGVLLVGTPPPFPGKVPSVTPQVVQLYAEMVLARIGTPRMPDRHRGGKRATRATPVQTLAQRVTMLEEQVRKLLEE